MQMIPFQIDSGKNGAGNAVPGAADGARQYGEGLGCEEVARKYRGKTGVLHGGIESGTFAGKPTEKITQRVVAENHGESPEEER